MLRRQAAQRVMSYLPGCFFLRAFTTMFFFFCCFTPAMPPFFADYAISRATLISARYYASDAFSYSQQISLCHLILRRYCRDIMLLYDDAAA